MAARRLVLATTMNTMTRMKNEDMMCGMPCVCERPERERPSHEPGRGPARRDVDFFSYRLLERLVFKPVGLDA